MSSFILLVSDEEKGHICLPYYYLGNKVIYVRDNARHISLVISYLKTIHFQLKSTTVTVFFIFKYVFIAVMVHLVSYFYNSNSSFRLPGVVAIIHFLRSLNFCIKV